MSKQRRFLISSVAILLLCCGPAAAEQGDTEVGFRLMWVTGSATGSGTIGASGSSPTLSSGPGLEIDWIYWPFDELTVEFSIGASPHPVGTVGGTFDGVDGGTLWRVPLSAVAQYRPDLFGKFDPYVGLGAVYNVMTYDESSTYNEHLSKAGFSNEIDIVAQIGVNYAIDVRWSANLDVRYMGLSTTGTFVTNDGASNELSFSMNPWVVGLGFRYRY